MKVFRSITFLTLLTSFVFGQEKKENLKITWPEQHNWKAASEQKDSSVYVISMIPGNETPEKWTTMVTIGYDKDKKFTPMEIVMNNTFNDEKQKSPNASLTFIERDQDEKNHWIIFKIEGILSTRKEYQSRLYYIIQGQDALYSNSLSLKAKSFSNDFVNKWKEYFKKSELEYITEL